MVPAEVCPLEIRSAGQSIVVAVTFLMTFVISQTFLATLCHIKSATFFVFGAWIGLMTIFVYLFLPETKKSAHGAGKASMEEALVMEEDCQGRTREETSRRILQ